MRHKWFVAGLLGLAELGVLGGMLVAVRNGLTWQSVFGFAGRNDLASRAQHRAILNNAEFLQFFAPPRAPAISGLHRDKLPDVKQQQRPAGTHSFHIGINYPEVRMIQSARCIKLAACQLAFRESALCQQFPLPCCFV